MGQKLQDHINAWKKKLLDLGRRNKLISYKDSKTATVRVVAPSIGELYDLITDGKELSFPCVINKPKILDIFALQEGKSDEDSDTIVKGDLSTDKETKDLQRVLKRIREKSKESIEERGINALYIAFGLLKWTENDNSSQEIMSPIILVPVKLTIASLTSPYVLSAHEDEIVLNPTLAYKMQNDFGIELPEFDATKDSPIEGFLQSVREMVNVKGWIVEDCACLGLFSFQKVNMYKDLDMNEELLKANPIVSALAGEENMPAIPEEFNNYDHDTRVKPIDTFQVVDADSSQQDAILLSKSNVSFVLQGPPGTGKSQTITNIISEALADGKKVLFVSEKMAALQVVYNRLADVGLSDYCLALHNPKANKKEMLNELSNSLSINRTRVREEAISQLTFLERKRQQLNNYHKELHTPCSELKITIFYANGELSKLEDTQDVIFEIADIEKIDKSELDDRLFLLSELSKTIGKKTEEYVNNVWRGSCVETVTNSLRQDIDFNVSKLLPLLKDSQSIIEYCGRTLFCTTSANLQGLSVLAQYLEIAGRSPIIPKEWVLSTDLQNLETDISTFKMLVTSYNEQFLNVAHLYIDSVWSDNIDSLVTSLSDN